MRLFERQRRISGKQKTTSSRSRCSTPATVGLTPDLTPAEPEFVQEEVVQVIAELEMGHFVIMEDVQS